VAVEIAPGLEVPDAEIEFAWIRSPGPGGQNVNKVATALQLRFNAAGSSLLDDGARTRLATLAGRRLARDGWLVLSAHRHRTQEGNRRDALERLAELIVAARIRITRAGARRQEAAHRHQAAARPPAGRLAICGATNVGVVSNLATRPAAASDSAARCR
jgi:ribosome-associated protein